MHFIQRNRLKQTVLIFMVTHNSYCYKNTFNLLFLFLNWIQVGRDERKRLTNLLLQLVLLGLSYASSNSLWSFLKLLLLFLNLTTGHLLLFFDYGKNLPSLFLLATSSGKKNPKLTALWYQCRNLTSPLVGFLMQRTNEQLNNTSLLRVQEKTYKINWRVKEG